MSQVAKSKQIILDRNDFDLPTEEQQIVRLVNARGSNLCEIEDSEGANYLVSMPTKFRKNVWIKRGDYLLIEPIKEGDKVKGEIVKILVPEHIKYFKQENVWPARFSNEEKTRPQEIPSSSSDSSDTDTSNETSSEDSDDEEESDYSTSVKN
ncbi:hypothetical protein GWI33_006191 [Rhynchophorus ferrugineus]|uniref:Probable RNA-binding protein EIF1AD n=1 Tax=Rhynchophorus ferrugineus TaxID=354439 RepID=A0A834II15_RHYFE|nr:hypothetical protein GWI33_006191 [Rhynchophorus ferrugineus]